MDRRRYTYEEIIQLLRKHEYTAPNVWDGIEEELDMGDQIDNLPTHKAPEGLWSAIESELDDINYEEDSEIEIKAETRKERKISGLTLLSIGVIIGMILLGSIQWYIQGEKEPDFQYKSEVESGTLLDNKIELDENVTEVLQYIEDNEYLFDEEQLTEFNSQLAEINEALSQLMEMQDNYGKDQSSNKMMAKIEREKANLLKSMIGKAG